MLRMRLRLRTIAAHITSSGSAAAVSEESPDEQPAVAIQVERLHPDFGARLHNVDLEALTDEQWETIQEALDGIEIFPVLSLGLSVRL